MNIAACFKRLRADGRCALIPFITAGYPNAAATVQLMQSMVAGGADLIELGIPFSDPMADGAAIQRASEEALLQGMTLPRVLQIVQQFRALDAETPVILMGYVNPIEAMGYKEFAAAAQDAGISGLLIVDMPFEEGRDFAPLLQERNIDQIFLISPNTSEDRLAKICAHASGFLYYVSLKGVTGSDQLDIASAQTKIQHIRKHTDLPLGIGFGIKDSATAATLATFGDGIIIGSALVEIIATHSENIGILNTEVRKFLSRFRNALDN